MTIAASLPGTQAVLSELQEVMSLSEVSASPQTRLLGYQTKIPQATLTGIYGH